MTDQSIFTAIASGIATITTGAMIVVIRMFLGTMREERRSFETFLGNHMSANVKAVEAVANGMDALTKSVELHYEKTKAAHLFLASKLDPKTGSALTEAIMKKEDK